MRRRILCPPKQNVNEKTAHKPNVSHRVARDLKKHTMAAAELDSANSRNYISNE